MHAEMMMDVELEARRTITDINFSYVVMDVKLEGNEILEYKLFWSWVADVFF